MMISGGFGRTGTKVEVEVISPSGNVSCSVRDLPQPRYGHSMNNNTVCGGYGGTGTDTRHNGAAAFFFAGTSEIDSVCT